MAYYQHSSEVFNGKKLVLFGAGRSGAQMLVLKLKGYNVAYFCDSDPKKWDTDFMGLPVYSPERLLQEEPDKTLVLITSIHSVQIKHQLEWMKMPCITMDEFDHIANMSFLYGNGFSIGLSERHKVLSQKTDDLNALFALLSDKKSKDLLDIILHKYKTGSPYFGDVYEMPPYFNDVFAHSISRDEVYVDGGVFLGDTILEFILYTDNQYAKIYGFEPDPLSYWQSVNKYKHMKDKIVLFNSAVYDKNGQTSFDGLQRGGSSIKRHGEYCANTVKLDDVIPEDEKVTFIKLDVEGSEYEAILGAERIIKAYNPKIAVAVYHRDDDLLRLPFLIHQLVPEYQLYLRHHDINMRETVLYAKM